MRNAKCGIRNSEYKIGCHPERMTNYAVEGSRPVNASN